MQMHTPNAHRRVALIAGCCMLLGGCAAFQRKLSPKESFPWVTEMGPAEHATAAIPPDAEAMGHFLKAEVALNQGDHDVANKEYELVQKGGEYSAPDDSALRVPQVVQNDWPSAKGDPHFTQTVLMFSPS